eukprot:SAG31_NODE_906_length_11091_cov_22.589065_11_plen_54_part_00
MAAAPVDDTGLPQMSEGEKYMFDLLGYVRPFNFFAISAARCSTRPWNDQSAQV